MTIESLLADAKTGRRTKDQLESLTTDPGGDELIDQPYVPVDVAALAGGGLLGEITNSSHAGTRSCAKPASIPPRARGSTRPRPSRAPAPPTSGRDCRPRTPTMWSSPTPTWSPPARAPSRSPRPSHSHWPAGATSPEPPPTASSPRSSAPTRAIRSWPPTTSWPPSSSSISRTLQIGSPRHRPRTAGFLAAFLADVPVDAPRRHVRQPGAPARHGEPVLRPGPQGWQRRAASRQLQSGPAPRVITAPRPNALSPRARTSPP